MNVYASIEIQKQLGLPTVEFIKRILLSYGNTQIHSHKIIIKDSHLFITPEFSQTLIYQLENEVPDSIEFLGLNEVDGWSILFVHEFCG